MSTSVSPVHVDATLDAAMSRWLWLVKWLLVVPHYVVLFFLWVTFAVLSVGAFVAILATGRYPRAIFTFNVGVMRWSWRVAFYAYGALGTDRYPPFTLAEVPDYPAHLEIEYPQHLSRGLALVKWWLLAIPHYLVITFFVGGSGLFLGWTVREGTVVAGSGLIGLLVAIAAVVLLFTGRYPQQIFDFVLGLHRWVLRVAGYAALMTDHYPPFRLDMDGHDPDAGRMDLRSAGPTAPSVSWTKASIVSVVLGSLLLALGGGLLTAGAAATAADQNLRDDQGFFMTPQRDLSTGGHALASEALALDIGAASLTPSSLLGDVRLTVTSPSTLFVGIASAADAREYLAGVQHTTLVGLQERGGETTARYREEAGAAPTVLPTATDIWVASTSGSGPQSLTWEPESGDWTLVVMNADGSPNVSAAVAIGATIPALDAVAPWLLGVGTALLLLSIALITGAVLRAGRRNNEPPDASAGRATHP